MPNSDIEISLNDLKKSRNEQSIKDWYINARKLIIILCSNDIKTIPCNATNSLSKDEAMDCMNELDQYFSTFGFVYKNDEETWEELSDWLRKIYI